MITTSSRATPIACTILAPRYAALGSGVPRIRLSTSWSRWKLTEIAMLLKQALITANAAIDAT